MGEMDGFDDGSVYAEALDAVFELFFCIDEEDE